MSRASQMLCIASLLTAKNNATLLSLGLIRTPHTNPVPEHKYWGSMMYTKKAWRVSTLSAPHSFDRNMWIVENLPLAIFRSAQGYAGHSGFGHEQTSNESAVKMIEQRQDKARKELNLLIAQHPLLSIVSLGKKCLKLLYMPANWHEYFSPWCSDGSCSGQRAAQSIFS